MDNEMFPPTENELDEMIITVQQKMETAATQLEYDQLYDELHELREKRRQLIIKNNTI
ncbi:hypothetical protein SAMN05421847_2155 [Halpernia humi]|uniref:Uncharacterized protein n=1 Tax=Halpernia humi TaxID=493375 RepID=A0A1H5ZSK8_9FLAO|nr:hypothetical protein [Halpernia humi]SEG38765.1 hypothetical protein SAMN05421847_2155 [Halpernia humi]